MLRVAFFLSFRFYCNHKKSGIADIMPLSPRIQELASLLQLSQLDDGTKEAALLQSGRVSLRPFHADDYVQWMTLRQQSRDFLSPWEGAWNECDLSSDFYHAMIARYAYEASIDKSYYFAILNQHDQSFLGGVHIADIKRGGFQTCSLGYWVGQPYARHGIMTAALPVVLSYSFLHLKLHRVEAVVHPDNDASIRLLEKFRFVCEGMARSCIYLDGFWQDHWLYSYLETDFLTYFLS